MTFFPKYLINYFMTLSMRNSIIVSAVILSSIVSLSAIACIIVYFPGTLTREYLGESMIPVLFAVVCTLAAAIIQYSFRKTLSAEITLFLVFLTFICFDALKPGMLLLKAFEKPIPWAVTLSRVVYFFRFAGIFSFLAAGLFASGLRTQRLSITLGICFLTALLFSLILPMDSSIREDNLLYRLGMHRDIQTAFIVLEIIAVLNYFTAAIRGNETAYFAAAVGAGSTIAGRELLFFHHEIVPVLAGFILFISGTILFAHKIHRIYLWK